MSANASNQDYIFNSSHTVVEVTILEEAHARGVFLLANSTQITATEGPFSNDTIAIQVNRQQGTFTSVNLPWVVHRCIYPACGRFELSPAVTQNLVPSSGNLTFADGVSVGMIDLTILKDTTMDGDQYFLLTLDAPASPATLSTSNYQVIIFVPAHNDRVGFNVTSVTTNKTAGPVNLYIIRSGSGTQTVTLNVNLNGKLRMGYT